MSHIHHTKKLARKNSNKTKCLCLFINITIITKKSLKTKAIYILKEFGTGVSIHSRRRRLLGGW